MSSYGVVSSGFVARDADAVLTQFQALLTTQVSAAFAEQAGVPTSLAGMVAGAVVSAGVGHWEVAESIYNAFDPASAIGTQLDAIGLLRGVTRQGATKSTVNLTVTLAAVTTLPAGQVVSNTDDSTIRFVTTAAVTSTTAGTYTVAAEAEVAGPVASAAGKLTVIDTPYSGWSAVTNAADATLGRNREPDDDYRLRQTNALATAGVGTAAAIRSALLAVSGVTQARVFANTTPNMIPSATTGTVDHYPGDIEAVIVGSGFATNDVAQALLDNVEAGTGTIGLSSGTATDADGTEYTRNFSAAPPLDLTFAVTVTTDSNYPADGDDQIKTAIGNYIDGFIIGQDVIYTKVYDVIFGVSGVTDVTALTINAGTSNITVGDREIANIATLASDVTVTS